MILVKKSLFNENRAFLVKWSILAKKLEFNENEVFSLPGHLFTPRGLPGGVPGGPRTGSHRATSGILGFQKIAQIVTFKGGILERLSGSAHR